MKKGFTILELLVASLLLGMLMTVLTMVFNQSSISWRVGEASVADLDDATGGIATVRYEADNLYPWESKTYALLSVWDRDGNLRTRAIDADGDATTLEQIQKLKSSGVASKQKPGEWSTISLESEKSSTPPSTYTVNVMSAGPNRTFDDYDDIWSFPDEFN